MCRCPYCYYHWLFWCCFYDVAFLKQIARYAEINPLGTYLWVQALDERMKGR